ncbi:hypothetical protein ACOSQ2_012747 [Xanthoceras sorbifolium]
MEGPDLIWTALLHGFNESMEISPWIHRIHRDLSMDSSNPWSFHARTSSFFAEVGEGLAATEDRWRTDRRTTSKID